MRQWHYILLSAVGMNIALFAKDLFIPILNPIAWQFHLSLQQSSWPLTVYLLGMAISQIFFGIYSDSFGRKNALLIGLAIFFAANALVFYTHSSILFMAERLCEGLGAGSIPVILRALAVDYYQHQALTKINSYLSMLTVISPLVAPFLGEYLQSSHLIMWNFHLLSILTLIALLLTLLMAKSKSEQTSSIKDVIVVFKQSTFWKYSFLSALSFSSVILIYLLSPYIFKHQTFLEPKWMGLMYAFIGIGYLIGTSVLLLLLKHLQEVNILYLGVALNVVSGILMMTLGSYSPLSVLAVFISMLLTSMGSGLITPLANKFAALSCPHLSGSALACLGSLRMLMGFMLGYLPVICIITPYRSLELGLLILSGTMVTLTMVK